MGMGRSRSSLRTLVFLPPLCAFLSGCVAIDVQERVERQALQSFEKLSEPKQQLKIFAACEGITDSWTVTCRLESEDTCDRLFVEVIQERKFIERTSADWAKGLEWGAAGALLGAGLWVTIDAQNVAPNDYWTSNPVGQTGAYAIGGSLLGLAAGMIAWAITDSVRALDSEEASEPKERIASSEPQTCDRKPLALQPVGGLSGSARFTITTDAEGRLELAVPTVIPAAQILSGQAAREIELFVDGSSITRIQIDRYIDDVLRKEQVRLEILAAQARSIGEINETISDLITVADGRACRSFLELKASSLGQHGIKRLEELMTCTAKGFIDEAKHAFETGDINAGKALRQRAVENDPNHSLLGELWRAELIGLQVLFDKALRAGDIEGSKRLAAECLVLEVPQTGLDSRDQECRSMARGVARAATLAEVIRGRPQNLQGALVAVLDRRSRMGLLKGLSREVLLRSSARAALSWVPTASVLALLPEDDDVLARQCLGEEECALGLLRQLKADFVLGLVLEDQAKGPSLQLTLIQPDGNRLVVERKVFQGTPEEIRRSLWSNLEIILSSAEVRHRSNRAVATKSASAEAPEVLESSDAGDSDGYIRLPAPPGFAEFVQGAEPLPKEVEDVAGLFATDDDVEEPSECSDPMVASAFAQVEHVEGTFKRSRALLIGPLVEPALGDKMRHRWLAAEGIWRTLLNTVRMKRIDYVKPCKPVTLADIQGKPLPGADFVFSLAVKGWDEEWKQVKDKKTGKTSENLEAIVVPVTLKIWDVRGSDWKEYADFELEIPGWLERGVFLADDMTYIATREAMKKVDGALSLGGALDSKGKTEGTVDSLITKATGRRQPVHLKDDELDWYVFKVKQSLTMAGAKLRVAVAKLPDFRLVSPMLQREDDEVFVSVGEAEGVRRGDTFVFSLGDPDVWEGFGRICDIGLGGNDGLANPSHVEVIADYDSQMDLLKAMEYPLVGIQIGLRAGLLPVTHGAHAVGDGDETLDLVVGMAGIGLDVRWRIPWIPVSELYQTTRVSYIIDVPLAVVSVDPGFEIRWFWGRFAPKLGLRYALGIVNAPIMDVNGDEQTGTALAHGLEFEIGFDIMLHPVWSLAFDFGWRQFFNNPSSVKYDGASYPLGFEVNMSGPMALLGLTYEF